MLMSIHLWHSEGLTERNWRILHAAGQCIARFGGPWIMGGDFNMMPANLQEAHDWLRQLGGEIKAPQVATCTNGNRVIDFVILDQRIAGGVHAIYTDLGFEAGSPNHAVIVRLRCKANRAMVRQLVKPKSFPADRPMGCSAEPHKSRMRSSSSSSMWPQGPTLVPLRTHTRTWSA